MTGIGGTSVNIDATELGRLRAAIGRWPRNYLTLVARHAALEHHAALLADDVARLTAENARLRALLVDAVYADAPVPYVPTDRLRPPGTDGGA